MIICREWSVKGILDNFGLRTKTSRLALVIRERFKEVLFNTLSLRLFSHLV